MAIGIWLAGAKGFAAETDAASTLTPTVEAKVEKDAVAGKDAVAEKGIEDAVPADATPVEGEEPLALQAEAATAPPASVPYEPGPDTANMSYWGLMAKLGLGLGMVVCLAWGAMWVLRRTSVGQQMVSNGGAVQVLERTFLAPKKAIYLVDIGGRTLALGVTDDNITALGEWEADQLSLAKPPPPQDLSSAFKSLLGQMRKQTAGESLK